MDQRDKAMWVHTLWDPLDEMHQSPLNSKKEGIRVAAYCRISKGNTNYRSLENQVSYYSNYIYNKPNWKFVGVYIDNQISGGTIEHRNGFKRMLRHAREGKIDLILTKSISRFSRNTKEILEVLQQLKESGTTVFFEREGVEVSKGLSSLVLETHAAMAQDFIEGVSNLVKFSYQKRLNEGRPYFHEMYGYDLVEPGGKDMVKINEEEAEVVRWIFNQFIGGATYADITRELIHRGIKTKKGNDRWAHTQIRKIINAIAYTGNKRAKAQTKDLFTGKITGSGPYKDQYMIENSHPAIISMDVFNRAQARVKKNKRTKKQIRTPISNPLKYRVFCGRCGKLVRRKNDYRYGCAYTNASVKLCDLELIKTYDLVAMGLRGLFERMLGLTIIATKNRKDITYEMVDPLGRSEKTLKEDFRLMLRDLERILIRVNQNDHFEFQRLKYFTDIEIAKRQNQIELIEQLEDEYSSFEEKVGRIEDDREYRNDALVWLRTIRGIDHFINSATIEMVRAWMTKLIIYSGSAYVIEWIDEKTTTIGQKEIPGIVEAAENKRLERESRLKKQEKPLLNDLINFEAAEDSLKDNENSKARRKEELLVEATAITADSKSLAKINNQNIPMRDVVVLERGLSIKDLGDLKKNILKNRMSQLKQEEKKKLRVAAYCRVSTEMDEQKLSLQTQLAYYNYKILSNPLWELAGIYADEGVSGTITEHRDDFNRMIEDAKKGKIDMIITKSISRFSRNVVDVLGTLKTLHELEPPCVCYFEKENLKSNDPNSSLILSLMATVAEEEIVSLSNSITWGVQSLAQRGTISRRTDMYGYTIDKNREWHIVEEEAEAVRLMYQLFIEGKNIFEIVEHLNELGIKSPKGSDYWNYNTIREILRNEKYLGDYEFQKYYTKVAGSVRKANYGQVPKYYIEEHHQAIIDRETFENAQKVFEDRKRNPVKNERKDGTAGREIYYKKFTCAECGHVVARYRSTTYYSREGSAWRCFNSFQKLGSTCNVSISFDERYMDYCFVDTLRKIKTSEDFRHQIKAHLRKLDLTKKELQHKEHLEKQMEALNQELYKAVDTEIQKNGKNTQLINQITDDIIQLREQHYKYIERLEQLEEDKERLEKLLKYCEKMKPFSLKTFHNMRPRIKPGDSVYSKTNSARDVSYMDLEGEDHLPEEVFIEYVLSATIDKAGEIKFKFAEGAEFGSGLDYEKYKERFEKQKKKIQMEELLISAEVQEVKEFCKEYRKPKEIREHLGIKSEISYRKRIQEPLYKAGKLMTNDAKVTQLRMYRWADEE
jgi:DNA invertase Pin-like site-specific DNA recombinase